MILNGFPVDPDRLKIVILSAPKTGNTWLRWLLHYAYRIPIVELPLEWAPGCADDLPPSVLAHRNRALPNRRRFGYNKTERTCLGNTPLSSCYFISRRVDVPR